MLVVKINYPPNTFRSKNPTWQNLIKKTIKKAISPVCSPDKVGVFFIQNEKLNEVEIEIDVFIKNFDIDTLEQCISKFMSDNKSIL